MQIALYNKLVDQVKGLIYYSESESPFFCMEMPVTNEDEIVPYLANYAEADTDCIKEITSYNFFSRFKNYIAFGRNDPEMYDNAQQFLVLQKFLKQNFEKIKIYRIEKVSATMIPIFFILKESERKYMALRTISEET